jgi:competence protein ComEA
MLHKLICALALALATQLSFVAPASAGVNINTATMDELVALPGIGPAKAQAIVDYRKANGPFKSVDDLKNVKGIGAKRLEKLRNDVSVGGPPARVAVAAGGKPEAKGAGPSAKGDVRGSAEAKPAK